MHRFWEEDGFDEELVQEQSNFMRSRQKAAASVTKRPQTQPTKMEIVEVEPTPLEIVPAAVVPNFDSHQDEDRDHIDIMGPLPSSTLPGVNIAAPPSFAPSRPKKSLFARQQELKRTSQAFSSNPLPNTISNDDQSPENNILADLVERDVVSFGDHPVSSESFAIHDKGFPETETIEPVHYSQAAEPQHSNPSFVPSDAPRLFYSSARDRLDPVSTINVQMDDVQQATEELVVEKTSVPVTPQSEFAHLMEEVSHDNDTSIAGMTPAEVAKLQQELAAHLSPKFLLMLKERGKQKALAAKLQEHAEHIPSASSSSVATTESKPEKPSTNSEEWSVTTSTGVYTIPQVQRKSTRSNTFLSDIERKKRQWLLPVKQSQFARPSSTLSDLNSDMASTERNHMSVELYRFDFEGKLLSYPSPQGNIDVETHGKTQDINMLLHHGEDPTEPGYTMNELNHLSRSAHPSQRISAIRALGNIIYKSKHCYYSLPMLNIPKIGAFATFPNNLFLSHLMQTLNVPIGIRIALDDTSNTQILEALYAMHALLCTESDEGVASLASLAPSAIYSYPLKPRDDENISLSSRDWDDKSDAERCEIDLILALLQTGLLSRLRYLLESKASPIMNTLILQIMIRCARHSQEACEHFWKCPDLLPCFKKLLTQCLSHPSGTDPNTPLLLKTILLICQGSRSTCQSCIKIGLVSSTFKFIQLSSNEIPSASQSSQNIDWAIQSTLLTLNLIETCVRYGLFRSSVVNILSLLMDIVTQSPSSHPSNRKPLIQAATWRLLTSLVPLARDIPEGEEIPSFVFLWSHIAPIVPHALSCLRNFDQLSESKVLSSDLDQLLAAILEFLATYFSQLELHPPRSFDTEKSQVKFISQQTLAPFLIASPYFTQVVTTLSKGASWRPNVTSGTAYFNVVPVALYAMPLYSHPAWSWKAQPSMRDHHQGGGMPLTTLEQNLFPLLSPNVPGSTLLHQASVLLSALRMTSAVNQHDPWLSASLTASEIAGPLSSVLAHYADWAMQCSGARGSVYATRTLHLLAYQTITLLYKSSIDAQEAGLVCLAHLLPGDERLALRLIERVTLYYTQEAPEDLTREQSLSGMLNISPGAFAYLITIINEGLGGSEGRSSRLLYLTEEDHPCDRESLLIDVEASAQPLGKHWIYNVFTHYAKHRAIEENDFAFKRQQAKSDAIKRGLEAHLAAKAKIESSSSDDNDSQNRDEEIEVELDPGMDLFGAYEDAESAKLRMAGISLIRDSLQFALNIERSNTSFAAKMKRSVKIYSIMQVFTLGPAFFMDEAIAKLLADLLTLYASQGWEPLTLDRSVILNTAIIEKIADIWANESFGDANIGAAIGLWLLAGASLNASQVASSGQSSELQALDSALWPHFATLWHLLPNPPLQLQKHYFQRNIVHRSLVAEFLLLAVCSPHTQKMRVQSNFWYQFIIFQLHHYFLSKHHDNVNQWTRRNSIVSLFNDLEHLSIQDKIDLIGDVFSLEVSQALGASSSPKKRSLDSLKTLDGVAEYLLQPVLSSLGGIEKD
jgi:hypothetical protein